MSEKQNPLEGRTEYVTVQEAADHLRVSQSTIYRWIKIGALKAFPSVLYNHVQSRPSVIHPKKCASMNSRSYLSF
jgi:transposase